MSGGSIWHEITVESVIYVGGGRRQGEPVSLPEFSANTENITEILETESLPGAALALGKANSGQATSIVSIGRFVAAENSPRGF